MWPSSSLDTAASSSAAFLTRVADQAAARSGSARAGARVNTMSGLAANIWRFFVFVIAIATILGMLGLNLTPLLASATIIGATLGFGAQQLIRDYLSGFLLTVEDQFSVGDTGSVDTISGTVEDVTMRVTRIRGIDGTLYFVPNGDIRLLANTSRGWSRATVDLVLAATSAADLDDVKRIVTEAAHRVADRPEFAGHTSEPAKLIGMIGADATTMTVRVTLHTSPSKRDAITRALREETMTDLAKAATCWPRLSGAPASMRRSLALPSAARATTLLAIVLLVTTLPLSPASAAAKAPSLFTSPLIGPARYGSSSWEVAPIALPPLTGSLELSCWSQSTCLASGALSDAAGNDNPSVLLGTTDGGVTWTYTDSFAHGLGSISCFAAKDCMAVGNGTTNQILLSTDSGTSWAPTTTPTFLPATLDAAFLSCTASFCLVIGSEANGHIPTNVTDAFTSTDQGKTWTPLSLPPHMSSTQALSCVSTQTCYLVYDTDTKQYSDIVTTSDRGQSWHVVKKAPGFTSPNGLSCPAVRTCDYLANQVVEVTTDGAHTWQADYGPFTPTHSDAVSAFSLACTSLSQCLIGGTGGKGAGQSLLWLEGTAWTAKRIKATLVTLDADSTKTMLADGNALTTDTGTAAANDFNSLVNDVTAGGGAVDVLSLHARGTEQTRLLTIGHAWNVLLASLSKHLVSEELNAGKALDTVTSATVSAGGAGRPEGRAGRRRHRPPAQRHRPLTCTFPRSLPIRVDGTIFVFMYQPTSERAPDERRDLGPDSLLWRWAGDNRIAFMGGTIGLLQLMHPAIGAGVMDHSDFFEDPYGRVFRSLPRILGVVYDEECTVTGKEVRAFHKTIGGPRQHPEPPLPTPSTRPPSGGPTPPSSSWPKGWRTATTAIA